jgi:hypothetical protein
MSVGFGASLLVATSSESSPLQWSLMPRLRLPAGRGALTVGAGVSGGNTCKGSPNVPFPDFGAREDPPSRRGRHAVRDDPGGSSGRNTRCGRTGNSAPNTSGSRASRYASSSAGRTGGPPAEGRQSLYRRSFRTPAWARATPSEHAHPRCLSALGERLRPRGCFPSRRARAAINGMRAGPRPRRLPYTGKDNEAITLLRPHTAPEVMASLDAWVADRKAVSGVLTSTRDEEATHRRRLRPARTSLGLDSSAWPWNPEAQNPVDKRGSRLTCR